MGADSLSIDLNISKEEAQKLIDDFYAGYPTVYKFIEGNKESVHKYGYVKGILGRRRRLPDALLPKYTIKRVGGTTNNFNPFLFTDNVSKLREDELVKKYREKLSATKGWREAQTIISDAKKDGVIITSNGGFISRAERQSTNAIIQGGAATITKLAMINVDSDKELKELGFRLLITVHDELIGECPNENSDKVAKRLSQVMIESAAKVCTVPMKCDCYKLFVA